MRFQTCVVLFILLLGLILPGFVVDAYADPGNLPPKFTVDYAKLGSALLVYLVLSIVLEMALTVIFGWRYFLKYAESKGLKTPLSILFAGIIVWSYELNVLTSILDVFNMCFDSDLTDLCTKSDTLGRGVTALLMTGGSKTVFSLLSKLGMRDEVKKKVRALASLA